MVEIELAPGRVVQLVRRDGKPYLRLKPFTAYAPSLRQAKMRALMARIGEMARRLSDEEVAEIVGGRVVRHNLIMMPDGRILPKTAALAAHYLKGVKPSAPAPAARLSRIPKWRRVVAQHEAEELQKLAQAVETLRRLASHAAKEQA